MQTIALFLIIQLLIGATASLVWAAYRYISQTYLPRMVCLDVYIDKKFSLLEKDAIYSGLRQWEQATKGLIGFSIIDDKANLSLDKVQNTEDSLVPGPIWILRNEASDKMTKWLDGYNDVEGLGYANINYAQKLIFLVVDRQNDRKKLAATVTHELGHVLWLDHSPNRRSIMYQKCTAIPQKITPDDVRRLYPFMGHCTYYMH